MINIQKNEIKKIGAAFLLIVAAFFIFKILHRPQMTIIVNYKDAPPLSSFFFTKTIDAHFRGYKVGKVSQITLSKDQKHLEFKLEIYYKNLRIPKNSSIMLRTENFYGKRYLDIHYPENPSPELLKDGDSIEGLDLYEGLDEYLIKEFKVGHSKNFLTNLSSITEILQKTLEQNDNEKFITRSAIDAAIILENLREIVDDPQVKKDFKSTIKYSSGTIKNIDEILEKKELQETINKAPESIERTIQNIETMNEHMDKINQAIPEVNQSVKTTNVLLKDTNSNLCSINKKVPEIPQSLVKNADKVLVRTDCFESELSKILSKRFLLLRLMFGNPGKSFKKCTKKDYDCSSSVFGN